MNKQVLRPYAVRLGIVFAISTIAVVLISEIGIRLQDENSARAPETIELVIAAGTAAKVKAGEAAPGIPDEIGFVLGDILQVRNLDEVTHMLGPLLIPPGSLAKMPLIDAENLILSCSFSPSRYLGLDIRTPTTLKTRLTAFFFAIPPTTAMLFVYSLGAIPIKANKGTENNSDS